MEITIGRYVVIQAVTLSSQVETIVFVSVDMVDSKCAVRIKKDIGAFFI